MSDTSPPIPAERDAAIARLVDDYGGRLFSIARKLCGNEDEAEDLVQETFLNAHRSWHTFRGDASPASWLFAIAARACQRMHRKRAGEPAHLFSLDDDDPPMPISGQLGDAAPEGGLDDAIRREAIARVEHAIASLPIEARLPLVLTEIVGLPARDIAAIMGLSEGAVRVRVHRARLALRHAVDAALPQRDFPEPAYDREVCLDLLAAKQRALDLGVAFDVGQPVLCERCQAVFAELDLAHDACRQIAEGDLPAELRQAILARLADN